MTRSAKKVRKDPEDEDTTVDTNVEGFYRDEVDRFHNDKEKLLLDVEKDEAGSNDEQSGASDEEVFGLHLSDEEEEGDEDQDDTAETFYASADEDEDDDDQQPELSDKAWGRSKKVFYNTDDVEGLGGSEEEEEAAELEEKEAMMLQKRLAAGLDQEDFGALDIALGEETEKAKKLQGQVETVEKDLSKLSSAEKLAIIGKDSPELVDLLGEFQEKLSHIMTTLVPVIEGAKRSSHLLTEEGEKYLETKLHIYQCYCLNILFYLLLKSNKQSILNHPVIEVIVKMRQLMDNLHSVDESLENQLAEALRCVTSNDNNYGPLRDQQKLQAAIGQKEVKSKKRKLAKEEGQDGVGVANSMALASGRKKQKVVPSDKQVIMDDKDSEDPLDYYYKVKAMKEAKKQAKLVRFSDSGGEDSEEENDGKRAINYQIAKNKGLAPKRKKEQRNPRVKHRKKFEKAKIKHKSQVHPVMPELQRYGGERTGIRANLSRSVRIK